MKKVLVSALALIAVVTSYAGGNGVDGHDEPVQGGFFWDLQLGVYPSGYMSSEDTPDEYKAGMLGYGLEIGNMFQLTDFGSGGDMGLGIRAIWFGFGAASGSNDLVQSAAINISILSPGVYWSKALGDNAVDVFLNYTPTVAAIASGSADGELGDLNFGGGAQFKLGATFRTGIWMFGAESNFGNLSYEITDDTGTEKISSPATHFKLLVGMKL